MIYSVEDFGKPVNCDHCYLSQGYGCGVLGAVFTESEMKSDVLPGSCPLMPVVPFSALVEILCEVEKAQTYKMVLGSQDLYLSREAVIGIIKDKIRENRE